MVAEHCCSRHVRCDIADTSSVTLNRCKCGALLVHTAAAATADASAALNCGSCCCTRLALTTHTSSRPEICALAILSEQSDSSIDLYNSL